MDQKDNRYQQYVDILKEELLPAMGCTEPIAIAYAAAIAKKALGHIPERLLIEVSGNIIKNVKSVTVPHTGGLRGIEVAAIAGAVVGEADAQLEVLSHVNEEDIKKIKEYKGLIRTDVTNADTPLIFDIMITAFCGEESSFVRIAGHHTNVVCIKKNRTLILNKAVNESENDLTDRSCLSIEGILDFADCVLLEDVKEVLERQISYNMEIAKEGLRNNYGANIGSTILYGNETDLSTRMKAYAAAGSDARMSGCELPVVINSGSGNQGITASIPVIVYANEKGFSAEELLRALIVSNLITIHLKTGIGRLSAYCGVVCAGVGAAAGVSYLGGGRLDEISHTIVNALAIDSGIICDGAKPSCAAKISTAVEVGLIGLKMYRRGNQFYGGDGIVKKGVENTITCVGLLARYGMEQTDKEIIKLMLDE